MSSNIDNSEQNYYVESLIQENKFLRQTIETLRKQLNELMKPPLMVCEVVSINGNNATIKIPNGNYFYVSIVNQNLKLYPGDTVLADRNNLNIVDKIDVDLDLSAESFVIMEKPKVKWSDVGGLDDVIREVREVVELPLKKPELFEKIGIEPPKGVLLYGPPGTGKTLIAKAVASETNAVFIEIVGSELVQKFIGEGAKLVRNIFDLARKKAPTIVFIDEIDSIASKRIELGTSGEREVQRTFMQLLAEIDGFKPLDNVKIIAATNRIDILDPAILRPGRFSRIIEVPLPKKKEQVIEILKIHIKNMNVKRINYDKLAELLLGMSGAEIKSVCVEAGYFAIRENRDKVIMDDFLKAIDKVKNKKEEKMEINMFG
ncbi:MAG: AAA family ATPase [Candidatus Woesearchaeota archaeon]